MSRACCTSTNAGPWTSASSRYAVTASSSAAPAAARPGASGRCGQERAPGPPTPRAGAPRDGTPIPVPLPRTGVRDRPRGTRTRHVLPAGRRVGRGLALPATQRVAGGREGPFAGAGATEPVACLVIGLDDQDPSAGTHEIREGPRGRERIGQVLQDADAEHRVGGRGRQGERAQVAGNGMQVHVHVSGEFAGVSRAMALHVERHHRQPRRGQGQGDVDLAIATAHVYQSLARVAPQVAADPMRPAGRPPAIPQVFERVGGQGVDVTRHGDYRSGRRCRILDSGGSRCPARMPRRVPRSAPTNQGTSLAMAVD